MRTQLSIPTMMLVLARMPNGFAESADMDRAAIVAAQIYRPSLARDLPAGSSFRLRRPSGSHCNGTMRD